MNLSTDTLPQAGTIIFDEIDDILELRQLRATLTNQLVQAIAQHKGCVLELRDTDHHNAEIQQLLRSTIKYAAGVITQLKKELGRVDQMIAEAIKGGEV